MSDTNSTNIVVRHLDGLRPHPDNPRGEVSPDTDEIKQLAASIKDKGILQPLTIMPDGTVVIGHRRRVAARLAGMTQVPCIERDMSRQEQLEIMLVENLQREDLSLLEEAKGYARLINELNLNVADIARRVNLPNTTVSQRLAILKLDQNVQALFGTDQMPSLAASWLARVSDPECQRRLASHLARRKITLNQLKETVTKEEAANSSTGSDAADKKRIPKPHRSTIAMRQNSNDPTRAEVVALLDYCTPRSLSVSTVRLALNETCCSCGMEDQPEICRACPLPQFIKTLLATCATTSVGGGIR